MHSCCVLSDNLWMERKTELGPQIGFSEDSGFVCRSCSAYGSKRGSFFFSLFSVT